eukprot:TRINITY_DN7941_c0_g1_i4.p1 TRINITY_DN7941_c0_g1~~TRINITY_DN7941_c0_g1_i4.p1  ORF type:complete len:288 (+),score=-19.67 TRINITY_DN7941_c0_g1_i4:232-1095(+)
MYPCQWDGQSKKATLKITNNNQILRALLGFFLLNYYQLLLKHTIQKKRKEKSTHNQKQKKIFQPKYIEFVIVTYRICKIISLVQNQISYYNSNEIQLIAYFFNIGRQSTSSQLLKIIIHNNLKKSFKSTPIYIPRTYKIIFSDKRPCDQNWEKNQTLLICGKKYIFFPLLSICERKGKNLFHKLKALFCTTFNQKTPNYQIGSSQPSFRALFWKFFLFSYSRAQIYLNDFIVTVFQSCLEEFRQKNTTFKKEIKRCTRLFQINLQSCLQEFRQKNTIYKKYIKKKCT